MSRKKKGHFLNIVGRADQIATCAKMLDIIQQSNGFSADPTETIN